MVPDSVTPPAPLSPGTPLLNASCNNERTVLECLHRRLEITRVLHLLLLLLLLAARLAGGFAALCLSQCGGSQKQEYAQNCDPFHMHVVLILMFKGLIV